MEGGYFPISNLYESLFFLAWGVTTIHLLAEWLSRSRLVGAATAPVAMGIAAFATLTLPDEMQSSAPLVPALKSNWLMMHVSVMMLSYSALLVGSLLAIAFLIVTFGQTVELKGSSIGTGSFRKRDTRDLQTSTDSSPAANTLDEGLSMSSAATAVLTPVSAPPAPSLSLTRMNLAESLDNMSYRMIGLGFPLLTVGIIAGAVWANEAWGAPWSWDPKETWALITWLVFAAYLHARITRGWQGRRPAYLATGGFFVVWVCYLGVNLLGKGLHSYGWFF
ncbi:c-type cytochrome biogenesis protein CcsB [Acaryochloris marina]|uniref:c-type cytochrome biogenesis protein CcsB n=1 Tax=Acaryochloris marina TaxID=155978 RepID=UPI0037C02E49